MISSFEVQDELLPHRLVSKTIKEKKKERTGDGKLTRKVKRVNIQDA